MLGSHAFILSCLPWGNASFTAGPDQNTTDNIPVRGLEGSFADVAMHPGAFAQEEHSLQAEEAHARAGMRDDPGEANQEGQTIDPPAGV